MLGVGNHMKEILESNTNKKISKKEEIIDIWENQHPIMFWWFGITTLSIFSVYFLLLTKF